MAGAHAGDASPGETGRGERNALFQASSLPQRLRLPRASPVHGLTCAGRPAPGEASPPGHVRCKVNNHTPGRYRCTHRVMQGFTVCDHCFFLKRDRVRRRRLLDLEQAAEYLQQQSHNKKMLPLEKPAAADREDATQIHEVTVKSEDMSVHSHTPPKDILTTTLRMTGTESTTSEAICEVFRSCAQDITSPGSSPGCCLELHADGCCAVGDPDSSAP